MLVLLGTAGALSAAGLAWSWWQVRRLQQAMRFVGRREMARLAFWRTVLLVTLAVLLITVVSISIGSIAA